MRTRLRLLRAGGITSGVEYRPYETEADGPDAGARRKERSQLAALRTQRAGQADRGKLRRFRDSDQRVGRYKLGFRLTHIGTALQQRGWQPRRGQCGAGERPYIAGG